jgi:hypothetical protein
VAAALQCDYTLLPRKRPNARFREVNQPSKLDQEQRPHPTPGLSGEASPPAESTSSTEHEGGAGTVGDGGFDRIFNQNRSLPTTFRGPTSHDFDLGLAKTNLQSELGPEKYQLNSWELSVPAASEYLADRLPLARALIDDPLQDLNLEDCKCLIQLYQHGPGAINPITDSKELIADCETVFHALKTSRTTDSLTTLITTAEKLNDPAIITLKLVLANGVVLDSGTTDKRFRSLFDNLRKPLSCCFWSLPNLSIIRNCLLLVRSYHNRTF